MNKIDFSDVLLKVFSINMFMNFLHEFVNCYDSFTDPILTSSTGKILTVIDLVLTLLIAIVLFKYSYKISTSVFKGSPNDSSQHFDFNSSRENFIFWVKLLGAYFVLAALEPLIRAIPYMFTSHGQMRVIFSLATIYIIIKPIIGVYILLAGSSHIAKLAYPVDSKAASSS